MNEMLAVCPNQACGITFTVQGIVSGRGSLNMEMAVGAASGKRVAEAKGLSKAFGDKVLVKGFSTRIQRGDRVAIVGPNGAGKTTLVHLAVGLLAPTAGTSVWAIRRR